MRDDVNALARQSEALVRERAPPRRRDHADGVRHLGRGAQAAAVLFGQNPILGRAEREPPSGAGRTEIGALGPHRERRLREEIRFRSTQPGERGFLLRRENAAGSAPSVEVIRQVDKAQLDLVPLQQTQTVRLRDQRVGVGNEAPPFDEQPPHALSLTVLEF